MCFTVLLYSCCSLVYISNIFTTQPTPPPPAADSCYLLPLKTEMFHFSGPSHTASLSIFSAQFVFMMMTTQMLEIPISMQTTKLIDGQLKVFRTIFAQSHAFFPLLPVSFKQRQKLETPTLLCGLILLWARTNEWVDWKWKRKWK